MCTKTSFTKLLNRLCIYTNVHARINIVHICSPDENGQQELQRDNFPYFSKEKDVVKFH